MDRDVWFQNCSMESRPGFRSRIVERPSNISPTTQPLTGCPGRPGPASYRGGSISTLSGPAVALSNSLRIRRQRTPRVPRDRPPSRAGQWSRRCRAAADRRAAGTADPCQGQACVRAARVLGAHQLRRQWPGCNTAGVRIGTHHSSVSLSQTWRTGRSRVPVAVLIRCLARAGQAWTAQNGAHW